MGQIHGKQIKDATVDTEQLAASAVETAKINNAAVDKDKLNSDVAGNGLTGGAGAALAVGAGGAASAIILAADTIAVKTDDATIEDDGATPGSLRVKDGGIDTTQLADDAVDEAKLDLAKTYDFSAAGGVKVATPSTDADAASKGYVDSVAEGLSTKGSVVATTTEAETLASDFEDGDVIDGVTLATGDRVLVKNQAAASENGIYVVKATGAPDRAADMPAASHAAGAYCFTEEGTINADTGWVCTTDAPNDVVGTNDLAFTQFSGVGELVAGAGLTKTGATVDVGQNATGSIKVNADDIAVVPDDVTIENDGGAAPGKLQVKDAGIDADALAASVAGDGLTGGAGSALSVDLKASGGLEIDTAELAVKVADIAGTNLESDGGSPAKLRIAAAAAGDGLKGGGVDALAVDVSDFAGTGLEDDGSENLRLATQGNGIAGGAGSTLSVLADPTGGANLSKSVNVSANGVAVKVDDDTVTEGASGQLKAATPTDGDKAQNPTGATSGDNQDTGVVIAKAPAGDGYARVFINGLAVECGDGVKTKDCYFSDGAAGARAFGAIVASDPLYWNGVIAGYDLATTDEIDMDYATAA